MKQEESTSKVNTMHVDSPLNIKISLTTKTQRKKSNGFTLANLKLFVID